MTLGLIALSPSILFPCLPHCIAVLPPLHRPALILGINLFASQIARLDMNAIAAGQKFDYTATGLDVDDIVSLVLFVTAAEELAKVILKRASLPTRHRSQPTTPVQPTFPANPNYSKESTGSDQSAGSADSKPEHYTDRYAYDFIRATMGALRDHVENIPWISSRLSKLTLRSLSPILSSL